MKFEYLGNQDILRIPHKTAFLASRNISPEAVIRCYDWATEQQKIDRCIISGFHSKLEKDVLHFLLKCKQSVILVLGRSMYKKLPTDLVDALANGRLLLISITTTVRQSKNTAFIRNQYIANMANEIIFGSLNKESSLYPLYEQAKMNQKDITLL